jgi:CDP-glycerol glycerophosphotransferase (TagB/SpsB family)
LREERPALLVSNIQMQVDVPLILAAQRNGLPLVGYVASWDHTVGKGVIWPGMRRYLVQNEVMRSDLARYHGIGAERVVVTGWPQTDLFHRRRPRAAYEELVEGYGLDPARPLVLVMGNTPTNAPYEDRFVARLVAWWEQGARERFQLLLRPHPRDRRWRERFSAGLGRSGAYVQEPRYTDLETLATLLQHGDCVVSNAGTILLDSIVNDRPAVCVLYDEGAAPGESWAAKNVTGKHYEELIESRAFYRATTFDEVTAGIERALNRPDELAGERARVSDTIVGRVDGRAAERVVDAALAALT